MRFRSVIYSALAFMIALAPLGYAEISGRTGRSKTFSGLQTVNGASTRFSVTIEPVSFGVNSVASKYKLVEVVVVNESPNVIACSSEQDRFEAIVNGQTVPAILSLQRSDSALWDGFSVERRRELAYPVRVNAAAPGGRGAAPGLVSEYVSMFVFFPADRMVTLPTEFRYTIASLGATVTLKLPPATGA